MCTNKKTNYFSLKNLIKIEIFDEKINNDFIYVPSRKEKKLLGIIICREKKEYWYVQSDEWYLDEYCDYNDESDLIYNKEDLLSKNYIIKNNKIFNKPYVKMIFNDEYINIKEFDTFKKAKVYVKNLIEKNNLSKELIEF